MFEFCIPTIQDYGAALKLNDWEKFRKCYDRLFLFFSMCTSKGVADYQRTMYVHMILMDYWKEQKLPFFEMLKEPYILLGGKWRDRCQHVGEYATSWDWCRTPSC